MYVFLDIDGVLNTESQWNKQYQLNQKCIENFCMFLSLLQKKYSKPIVVLTSTWRAGFDANNNHLEPVQRLINSISKMAKVEFDKTAKSFDDNRMREIKYYLSRHSKSEFVIIDDDRNLFSKDDNIFYINSKTGFSSSDIKRGLQYVDNF